MDLNNIIKDLEKKKIVKGDNEKKSFKDIFGLFFNFKKILREMKNE